MICSSENDDWQAAGDAASHIAGDRMTLETLERRLAYLLMELYAGIGDLEQFRESILSVVDFCSSNASFFIDEDHLIDSIRAVWQ